MILQFFRQSLKTHAKKSRDMDIGFHQDQTMTKGIQLHETLKDLARHIRTTIVYKKLRINQRRLNKMHIEAEAKTPILRTRQEVKVLKNKRLSFIFTLGSTFTKISN